ncbi:hypothetical protein AXF42_Ash020800 [Apostasia shenzhenica]|uniref:Uncharacterized protein n=1 Tax=Apostasia shenzhenica TaxID=1088818 RepID=A0A2I0AR75_9ASPA|nr:hypothetical protein AXF42_Ash020800 [Apostasia shenzhenica]
MILKKNMVFQRKLYGIYLRYRALQDYFKIKKYAKNLTWPADGKRRVFDRMMRHSTDSPQWKSFDIRFSNFAEDPRNLRLRLCTDGFNPHSVQSSQHNCWPVFLVIYNLPPNLCMKHKFIMLTLLISRPKQPEKR